MWTAQEQLSEKNNIRHEGQTVYNSGKRRLITSPVYSGSRYAMGKKGNWRRGRRVNVHVTMQNKTQQKEQA